MDENYPNAMMPFITEGRFPQVNFIKNIKESDSESHFQEFQQNSNNISMNLHQLIIDQDKEIRYLREELSANNTHLESKFKNIIGNLTDNVKELKMKIEKLEGNMRTFKPGELIWEISKLSDQKSDSFLSYENGYKMRLDLKIEKYWICSHLNFTVEMAQTSSNSCLPWPNEFDVRIGIVNQSNDKYLENVKQVIKFESLESPHTMPFQFVFKRIMEPAWKNDIIIIKCTVC